MRNNWLDNFVGFFSPRAKAKRLAGRELVSFFEKPKRARKYDAAARGRRTSGWNASSLSADSENKSAIATLRSRSRDLVRNNAYAAKGIEVIASNTVGAGIITQIKHPTARRQKQLGELWSEWAETNKIDFNGRLDIYGLQRAVIRSVVESGEILLRRRVVSDNPIPFQYQILEGDFIAQDMIVEQVDNGNTVIQGIEYNSQGKRVAYHLYKEHPGSTDFFGRVANFDTVRVPADEIYHIYRQDRANQNRGVPWLHSVMLRLKDFDDYEQAQLVRQKIAACFAVFERDIQAPDGEPTGNEGTTDNLEKVEPGIYEKLGPGRTIEFANPPGVTGYKEYTSVMLHSIAAGLGVTYESLTSDLSDVNFSSARMGWLEFQRNLDVWRWQIIISQFLNPVTEDFRRGAILMGAESTDKMKATHTPPRREMIDPTKEVPATIKAIRGGLISLSEAVRQNGEDPDAHFAEMQEDNKKLDSLGLTLDTDPRKTSSNGTLQSDSDSTPSGDESDDS